MHKWSDRTIAELEQLIADYGEEYHGGFFKQLLDEIKAQRGA